MTDTLKPCPFCGNKEPEYDDLSVWCVCIAGSVEYNQWQQRAFQPEIQELVEAAKKWYEDVMNSPQTLKFYKDRGFEMCMSADRLLYAIKELDRREQK